MKQLRTFFYKIIFVLILLSYNGISQSNAQSLDSSIDSVEFSLLTCSPGNEVYSIYGHTAIRYLDKSRNEDWTFNYGIFNFKQPFFVGRFLFGFTDYELGVLPYSIFKKEYGKHNRQVVEQVLNLTSEEKQRLYHALINNYAPENRVYRYNFLYCNCTTKARDIIESCINGDIQYTDTNAEKQTYRQMLHEYTIGLPWHEYGNDICMGLIADMPIDSRQQQFLPLRLQYDFNRAQIYLNGRYRPLVKSQQVVVEAGIQIITSEFPLSPLSSSLILLGVSTLIALIEFRSKRIFKFWDVILTTITGICGIILALLFISQHPTTSSNLQILVLNPINLFFIIKIIKGKQTIYWKLSALLTIIFLIGSIIQDYAEGMFFVALSLLIRNWINLKISPNTTKR